MNDTELALFMKRGADIVHDIDVLYHSKNYNAHEFIMGTLAYIASINSGSSDPQQSMNDIISLFKTLCSNANKRNT